MAIRPKLERGDTRAPFDEFYRNARQVMERAALKTTDQAARKAVLQMRGEIQSAGLGRLGNALGNTSDLQKGRGVRRRGEGFSASGVVFVRSGSARSRGAIEAYTQGAEIRPVRGRWLWIPTDDIQRRAGASAGRKRITPGNWSEAGLDARIGPLVPVKSVNGYPLLVVKNAGVSEAGRPRSARSLTRGGRPRKGQRAKEFMVAFVGIPRTARAARVDVSAIMAAVRNELPLLFEQALAGERRDSRQ
jgi:hypothetical protein